MLLNDPNGIIARLMQHIGHLNGQILVNLEIHRSLCRNGYHTLTRQLSSVGHRSLECLPIQRGVTAQDLIGGETSSKVVKYH